MLVCRARGLAKGFSILCEETRCALLELPRKYSMSTAASPIAASIVPPPRALRPSLDGTRRLAVVVPDKPWTIGIICIVVYLFVVHSFKLNVGSVAIGVGLGAVLLSGNKLRVSKPMMWYLGFLVWALITLPFSLAPLTSWERWVDSLKIVLIMFVMINAIRTKTQHRIVTLAWLAMFAFYPVRGTLLNFATGQGSFGRYGWNFTFANYNDLAALTLLPLALCLDRLRTQEKKWVKVCAFAGLIVMPFIVLITQSRGGMLGLAAFMVFLLARSRYRARLTVAVGIIGVGAVLFAPQAVWDRISGMSYLTSTETLGEADSSAEQRYQILQVAGSIIADYPVFGVGIGAYPVAHERYALINQEWSSANGRRDTHNTYLHVLAENGFVGLGLYMMIFISAFVELTRGRRNALSDSSVEAKEVADRYQAYQAGFVGLAVCAVFGSLDGIVFPFLLLSLATVTGMIFGSTPPAVERPRFGRRAGVPPR